jgi:hypothetical protein
MKAIVCDKCGKVVLLPDEPLRCPEGINTLVMRGTHREIDLCDECVDELVAAVRKENEP